MLAAATPALALAHAIGRVGCFLVGDDYGIPSDVPWAVAFPEGLPPTSLRVHPTQLYETAALLPFVSDGDVATAVLLQHMQTVSFFANVALQPDSTAAVAELRGASRAELLHAGLGLVVLLLLIEVLNVYKPQGMTAFGRRTSQIAATAQPLDADASVQRTQSARGSPFWVRVVGAHAIGLVVLLTIMHLTGGGLRFH